MVTELFRLLKLMEMDLAMIKASFKEEAWAGQGLSQCG
jgi:hypothetical protein